MADTAAALLARARRLFAAQEIATAALDARLLLQAAAGISHGALIAEPDQRIGSEGFERFETYVKRRLLFEPVSKILGEREFYGRLFHVTADVLDPRPDTETLVALVLKHVSPSKPMRFADLGSGSGAIVVTLLAELPLAKGIAVDFSAHARNVTMANGTRLAVADRLVVADGPWLANVDGMLDFIVSNPPYIPRREIAALPADVRDHDPHLALDGGADGLDCYRAIALAAPSRLAPQGFVAVEIGAGQQFDVNAIFEQSGFLLCDQLLDLSGHVRALLFKRA